MKRSWTIWVLAPLVAVAIGGCDMKKFSWPGKKTPKVAEGDDAFTILLGRVSGTDHASRAKALKAALEKESGWKDLFIVHQSGHTELCRGKYPTIESAQKDLKGVKAYQYKNAAGETTQPFKRVFLVALPGKSIGPPEWELTRQGGAYTVEVGTFYDVPKDNYVGRKRFAVQYCQQLRQDGYDAFYYHGVSRSSVTIGSFPATAVQAREDGTKTVAEPKITHILNLAKFKYYAVNGRTEWVTTKDPRTNKKTKIQRRSFLVRIKKTKQPTAGTGMGQAPAGTGGPVRVAP